ncbi:MAG: hypothetical protein L0211_21740 [Planctomycetaceae bacterium]|nr:hypothetical protein [Planctomycetaceae bacterium]
MTATFTAERRRSPTPPRPLRELPVLFHLMDVSRPKGYTAPAPPAFTLGSAADALPHRESPLSGRLPSEPAIEGAESFDLETASELVQTKAYGSLPPDAPQLGAQPGDPRADAAGAHSDHDSIDTISSLETPPPPADEAVTLRQRAEERQRKRQEGKKDDWFTTQGKFIAIGFLAALVVTIYVARTSRKPASPPVAAKSHVHAGTAAKAKAAQKSAAKPAAIAESARITSVRPTAKPAVSQPAASQPTTALHPPTIPQLAPQREPAKTPADETLFTFTRRTDERVAASNATPAAAPAAVPQTNTAAPPLVPQPAPQAVPQTAAASAPATPHLQPQYPATSYPSTYQPVAPPPVYAPPPASPAGPNLGPAASTMPLYPTTNSASGTRYERTGSGLY